MPSTRGLFTPGRVLLICSLLLSVQSAGAPAASEDGGCATTTAVTVISGATINGLAGTPVENISLYRYANDALLPIVSQIDQRDDEDRYLLDGLTVLDGNDEIVFATADTGSRLPLDSPYRKELELTEIQTGGAASAAPRGWIYASPRQSRLLSPDKPLVTYSADDDIVETAIYRAGFSPLRPFLLDSLQWNLGKDNQWSPDLIDGMKIRHLGKLFGMMSFERSQKDYTSVLSGVKTGPLRVIRRTENRVRVFWQLESPRLKIDYVMGPDGFVMDTVVDIPFSPGLFFSDVETLTTVDWNPSPVLPAIFIESGDGLIRLPVSGKPSAKEDAFNQSPGNRFLVHSRSGIIAAQLDIPESLALESTLYLHDDMTVADPPEQFRGLFGNVGFKTTRWEDISAGVHHLKFSVCFSSANP